MNEALDKFQVNILKGVDERLLHIQVARPQDEPPAGLYHPEEGTPVPTFDNGRFFAFHYADEDSMDTKFWQLPKGFVFPKVDRRTGWRFWILGMPYHHEKQKYGTLKVHPISPFRLFDTKIIPKKAKISWKVNWLPLFSIMQEVIANAVLHPNEITAAYIDALFDAGT